jgi:endonuclease G
MKRHLMFARLNTPSHRTSLALLLSLLVASPILHAESATATAADYLRTHNQITAGAANDEDDGQSPPECTINYYQGDAPNFINQKLATNTTELCFDGFTVMYSGVTRTPLWSAEHLTRERLDNAQTLSRLNNFHEEMKLPFEVRSTLGDYKGSGFDRGHMSPNGDMGTRDQQFNSFSLANIVPQNSFNNQHPWRMLEEATRELIKQEGEAYVITGAAFLGDQFRQIGNVIVPSDVFKVVYFPRRNAVGVYFSPNDASNQVEVITLAELNKRIGLDLMPSLADTVKNHRVDMPLNTSWSQRSGSDFAGNGQSSHAASSAGQPPNYGTSNTSQTKPAKRGLFTRIVCALLHCSY